jgi:hypothetical protein
MTRKNAWPCLKNYQISIQGVCKDVAMLRLYQKRKACGFLWIAIALKNENINR